MMAGSRCWRCFVVAITLLSASSLRLASAELFSVSVKEPKKFQTLNVFFIYARADAPDAVQPAIVNFSNFELGVEPGMKQEMKGYDGIEVGLIRYQDYQQMHMEYFCCTKEDVALGACHVPHKMNWTLGVARNKLDHEPQVFWHQVPTLKGFKGKGDVQKIHYTGAYVLTLSNCGEIAPLTGVNVTGDVLMQNPFGYLPGIDYYKLPLYRGLAMTYVALGGIWALLSLIYRKELFNIQICIGVVLFLGLVEVSLWYFNYLSWNLTGVKNMTIFVLAVLFSVVKSIFSYMLVLVGAMGWGITRPTLEPSTVCAIRCCCAVFIPLDFIRRMVLSFQHDRQVPLTFVLGILLPCSIMNGLIFYWVFSSLGTSIDTLTAKKQTEKLKLFHRLWCLLVLALILLTLGQLAEFAMVSLDEEVQWLYQWMFEDGVSHVLFLFVLFFQMLLWRPHKESQRYAYSQQLGDEGDNEEVPQDPFTVGDVFDDDDDDGDDDLKPQATKVGAS
mmetsp:Transcript_73434/g.175002  ORF Transcript_73434/g.175002 Transcript_73434/m.175002 type:complete len:500 (-) Transcript_73434:65-1564(-)